jgi:hypothetical protein
MIIKRAKTAWQKIKWRARAAWWWADEQLPVLCDCGHVVKKKSIRYETTTWGKVVLFCPRCHDERFGGSNELR